jgi:D-glycero-alpha-D-manno-heptose-7-phosphate kinase
MMRNLLSEDTRKPPKRRTRGMIISKTPCRISFAGGGSDIRAFYKRFGGAVVSTSIDKYVYITVNQKFDRRVRVSYSRTEEVDTVEEVEHPIVREALRMINPAGGVEITSIADIPSRGTGLGSSSSFTVGLLNSLFAFKGRHVSYQILGGLSSMIEIERCGQPIGKQDHYAAAAGGFNFIRFNKDDSVDVVPIVCNARTRAEIQRNMLLFYTGITRSATEILGRQTLALKESADTISRTKRLAALATELRDELQANNADAIGEVLHENWMLKRDVVDGVTNDLIDRWYLAARQAGALGGKILGAGGGGFLLIYARQRQHRAIEAALPDLRKIPVSFEPEGSRIIMYSPAWTDKERRAARSAG